jgi:hypothetical protein
VKFVHKEGGQFQAERAWRTIHAWSRTDSSKKPFYKLSNVSGDTDVIPT